MPGWDPWIFPDALGYTAAGSEEHGLVGYHVEAIDGSIGKIDKVGDAFLYRALSYAVNA